VRNWTGKVMIVTLVLGLLAIASPARAQIDEGILISAGGGLLYFDGVTDPLVGAAGNVSKTLKMLGPAVGLGVVGDLGWFADRGYRNAAYQGGLRVTLVRYARFRPFGQGMAGLEQTRYASSRVNNFMVTPGGGVDFPIGDMFRIRVQVDFPIVISEDTTDFGQRYYAGLAFTFGGG